ncbi:MAG: ribbon-helix-helix protein, CopG family [Bacillota bacterium]
MSSGAKNYTFTLPVETVEKLRRHVREARLPSLNAGVREAIEEYVAKLDREQFRREMEAAGEDEAFLADIREIMNAFAPADLEVAKRSGE